MPLKIRMSRGGTKKRPFYRIVVTDSRNPRDGRYIERVGSYNPMLAKDHPDRVVLKSDRIKHWLGEGARPSDRVAKFLGRAEIIAMPAQRNNPKQSQPRPKTVARMKAAEEARKAAEEARKAAAEAAPAEAAPVETTPADAAPAEDAPAEDAPAAAQAVAEPAAEPAAVEVAPEEPPAEAPVAAAAEPAGDAPADEKSAAAGEAGEDGKSDEEGKSD